MRDDNLRAKKVLGVCVFAQEPSTFFVVPQRAASFTHDQ